MSRQYRDDYARDSRGGRDRAEPRDARREAREPVRDTREPPRSARDPRDMRDTRERPDPYASRTMDDSMDIDPPRIGGRLESGRERGGMDPRMDARMDGRMDNRMEQPQEAVGYREYRDPRTGVIMRESVPTRPQRRDRDEFEEDPRDTRIARRPMEYDTPLDDPRGGARPRFNDYFLPGDGINREVIQHDICRYLGQDATVRPTRHRDGRLGYTITAYRALTTAMISSLKQDSAKFEQEQRQRKYNSDSQVPYTSSNTVGNRDVLEREEPRRAPYRGVQPMDIDEEDYATGPIPGGAYGDDPYSSGRRVGPPTNSRHQVPVTTAGYASEPGFPPSTYPAGSYTLAPSTSAPAYYDPNDPRSREPRAFANLTPDSAARAAQYPPSGGYPANTQAMRQPAATLYVDPRTGRSEAIPAGYPSTSGPYQEPPRHRR